jgi:hypothetical protein
VSLFDAAVVHAYKGYKNETRSVQLFGRMSLVEKKISYTPTLQVAAAAKKLSKY